METAIAPLDSLHEAAADGARRGFLFRMLRGSRREMAFWILHGLFWTAVGLIGFLITAAFQAAAPEVGRALLVRMASGFVLSAGLRGIYLQPWLRHGRGWTKWLLAACFCLLFAFLEVLVLKALSSAGVAIPGGVETLGLRLLLVRGFILGVWSALYFAVHMVEDEHALELRATRAELAAREFELRHLQAQMNPHFVFHALDGVLASKHDPQAVEEMTRGLADYLSFLLRETEPLVPLGRELEALEKFLTIQASCIRRNLVCRVNWDPAARTVMVPPMTVQPLVENAFLHRPATNDLPLQIWLTAAVERGFLRVTLSNTGEPTPQDGLPKPGDGIDALRKRLTLLLGPEARVERQADDGWIRVSVIVPVRENPAANPQIPRPAP